MLIGDYNEGDMKDIDIKAKLGSLQIQWVKRLRNNNFHSWKIISNVLLKDMGGYFCFFLLKYLQSQKNNNHFEQPKRITICQISNPK